MASPQQQQQLMASPQQQAQQQQQQSGNTPGPSPGGSQTQPGGGGANSSPMNGGMNAAMTMNPSGMSTINMSAMNSMMPSLANNGMAGMTMTSMNAAGFQQSMGHPVMSSGAMPQVWIMNDFHLLTIIDIQLVLWFRFKLSSNNFLTCLSYTVTLRVNNLLCREIFLCSQRVSIKPYR